MPNPSRRSILALVLLLLAACGGVAPSTSPSAASSQLAQATDEPLASSEASAEPTQVHTIPPLPSLTPAPSVDPYGDCPVLTPEMPDPLVHLGTSDGHVDLEPSITAIEALGGGPALPAPPSRDGGFNHAFFVGGREATFDVWYGAPYWNWVGPITIRKLRAVLTLEGQTPVELPVRYQEDGYGNTAIVRTPDVGGRGTLDVSIKVRDRCHVVTASVTAPVQVDTAASVSGCATRRAGGFAEVDAEFEAPITVGPASVDIVPWYFHGKVVNLAFIDPYPPHVWFKADSPVIEVAPGSTVLISDLPSAVELDPFESGEVTFYRRAPLLRWVTNGYIHGDEPEAPIVFRSPLVELPDGTYGFTVPDDAARYAAEVVFEYMATCSYGTAGFVLGVDVVAP